MLIKVKFDKKVNIIKLLLSLWSNYRQLSKMAFIFAVTFLISSCTNLQQPSSITTIKTHYQKQTPEQRAAMLSRLTQWNTEGVFSIQQTKETIMAAYKWKQKGSNYHINIHSAFNLYTVDIFGHPGKVTLQSSPQEVFVSQTPEQLVQKTLGWQLPISNLHYWVRGIPGANPYNATYDWYGHLITLQQDGWRVYFSQYVTANHIDVPCILELKKSPFIIKIVIKRWKIN